MYASGLKLFTLFGFEVRLDVSWVIIAVLVVWSLSLGLFPALIPHLGPTAYWLMGIAGAIVLFASIIAHEFFHSLVARRFGIPMRGITLFLFGGLAEMGEEPPNAHSEFLMAAAGPLSSLATAGLGFAALAAGRRLNWPLPVLGVFDYWILVNLLLALFNLLPAFPLDGGRMLRAALWGWRKDFLWATRIAAFLGAFLAACLMLWGAFNILLGEFIGGLWIALIGWFLQHAARHSYRRAVNRRILQDEPVRRLMRVDTVTVPPSLSLRRWVDDYILRYHFKMYPVLDHERLVACVTAGHLARIPREDWPRRTVSEIADACTPDSTVGPDDNAAKALAVMNRTGASRLPVADHEQLVGVITLGDLQQYLALTLSAKQQPFNADDIGRTQAPTERGFPGRKEN